MLRWPNGKTILMYHHSIPQHTLNSLEAFIPTVATQTIPMWCTSSNLQLRRRLLTAHAVLLAVVLVSVYVVELFVLNAVEKYCAAAAKRFNLIKLLETNKE